MTNVDQATGKTAIGEIPRSDVVSTTEPAQTATQSTDFGDKTAERSAGAPHSAIDTQTSPQEVPTSTPRAGYNGLRNDKNRCYQYATFQNLANLSRLASRFNNAHWANEQVVSDTETKVTELEAKLKEGIATEDDLKALRQSM